MKKNSNYLDDIFQLNKKKIIITGCSGQLGTALINAFLNCGCIVIGLDLQKPKKNLIKIFIIFK